MARRLIVFRPPLPPPQPPEKRPKRRWWPYRWRYRVQGSWVERTLSPFLALAGVLGGVSGTALTFRKFEWLQNLMVELGLTAWLQSHSMLLQYMTAFAVLAFLLLLMIKVGLLDGIWIFSIARNFLVLAVLSLIVLIFDIFPQNLFTGFFVIVLMLAVVISFLTFGPAREHLVKRAMGDFVGELVFMSLFLGLFAPIFWSLPATRQACELLLDVWQKLPALLPAS